MLVFRSVNVAKLEAADTTSIRANCH